ncbi:actin-related protein 5 isoform X1 [Nilaparvata lugens]|uniref:actin-related protein 5 isoform X1 n=1 Tax=Nilaparvata lugens TaxID=108931 RepID=UPI00193DDAD4|nr:actin-related protein 5 isoform X1 [Nilaparvata lugens]XP_039283764.1 actin-related protein 5 isoform X2 [Nilaparvata lugens]XP_039283771.1 actin-related protein 5 isoform X1 [Nilaparvata lugens]
MADTAEKVETLELKDIKPVPDVYHAYTKAIQDAVTPIVIDNGSYNCRAGWASNENPMMVFRNLIAKPRKERGKKDGETQIGNDITNIEAVRFQLKQQFDRNVVVHYETQEQIFDHIFSHLGIDTEGRVGHPIVITEPYLNPNYSRALMSELLFECYQVPGVCYAVDALCGFQGGDHTEGLVVVLGHHCTHVLPVLGGRVDGAQARRLAVGGHHVTCYLHRLLQLKYPAHSQAITLTRAEELLHEHCYLSAGDRNYCDEVWQWADCDYYERNVIRVQLPYQAALGGSGAGSSEDQQRQRRQELKRRLLEINARKREEKLAEDEEHLNQLLAVQDVEAEGDEQELERSLVWFNLQNTDELRKAIKDVQQRIEKTRQRIVAANTADDSVIEETKPKPSSKPGLMAPVEGGEAAVAEWVASLRMRRQQLMERRTARKQRLADMAKRRTVAAQERMRLISQLAGGGGGSGSGEGGSGRRGGKDDDFGARDEDWDVYKAINKEGGDSDSEEETEKLLELEEALRLHDPQWGRGQSGTAEGGVGEAHQLHVGIERLRATECLFQPHLVGCAQAGLAELIEFVLNRYDTETQARLAGNVFVTGGCARIPGLEARLTKELLEMRPFQSHFKVTLHGGGGADASLGAWKGARRLANEPDFRQRFMTSRQDYLERGADYFREHRASNVYVPTPVVIPITQATDNMSIDQ